MISNAIDEKDTKIDRTDSEADEGQQEAFIPLSKPKQYTRIVADSIEYRPAAVLNTCQFLNKLSAKCKEDLHKLGCNRGHHSGTPRSKSKSNINVHSAPSNTKHTGPVKHHHHHHHHHKEPWEKRFQRLKVYQRAFSSIVMYFKAYCPVLFYIKKTYEDMLSYRVNQIKLAHFEKKRLQIQKHSMRRQMHEYIFPEYYQLLKQEKYLGILRQRIALQEEAIKVITGILQKMEESLSDHFERHRDLEEQIIMVDTEIANRRQKAFSMREKEEKEVKEKSANVAEHETASKAIIDSDEEDKDDPFYNIDSEEIDEERRMVWIMAFAICHKDLEDAEKKLAMYQTKYQYVVPRHEHESMKRSIVDEKVTAKQLADEKGVLEDELASLKELEVKLEEELIAIKAQLTELRTLVTPRPSWEQLGEFVQGGVPKWTKLIQGKSTKDAAEKLVSELRSRRGGEKFFQPLGTEQKVLRCLRHGKRVLDRQLHSRDTALMIHDIWMTRKKVLEDNVNSPVQKDEFDFGKDENVGHKSFQDFVAIYFEDRYEDVEIRMEWTYNLVECCKRFSLDYRLTSFLNVLQDECDEGIYFLTRNELFRVRNIFLEKSVEEGMSPGTLSSNQYVEALETAFPNKAEAEIQSIVRVTNKLNVELNPEEGADLSIYRITQLIDIRDDGFRGALVGELVKQFEEDKNAFIDKIVAELANYLEISPAAASNEFDPSSNKDVSVVQVYSAIKSVDADIDDEKSGAALAWIFTQTSVLLGGGINTSRLVNYAKLHSGEKESAVDLSAGDDAKFERAIQDIIREEEDINEEQQMSDIQKKAFYRALKTAKLRTVVQRLRGSRLVPSWRYYDPQKSLLPETSINLEKDLDALKAKVEEERAKPSSPTEGALHGVNSAGSMEDGGEGHSVPTDAAPTVAVVEPEKKIEASETPS